MDTTNFQVADFGRRLTGELKRDKKKSAVLILLLVTAGIVGGRLVVTRCVPDRAPAASGAGLAPGDWDDAERVGDDRVAAWLGADRRSRDARREKYLATMDRAIDRDLFSPNLACFPLAPGRSAAPLKPGRSRPGWFGRLRERVMEKQDARNQEQTRIDAVRAQARALSLTSTMLGSRPAAVINRRVLATGEYISGFRVEDIGSDSCTLSKDGVSVKLTMAK